MKNNLSNIYFDDLQVEATLFNKNSAKKPTNVCIFERWMEGIKLSEDEYLILISILENLNYKDFTELNLTIITGKLLSKKITRNPGLLFKFFSFLLISKYKFLINVIAQFPADMVHKLILKVNSQRNKYLEIKKQEQRKKSSEGYSLRHLSKKLVDENNFDEALKHYETMLGLKFQIANTYVHIARVLLLLNNYKQAEISVKKSWKHKKGINVNDAYVLPRILFLKIFFALIREKEYEAKLFIIKLKQTISKEGQKCVEEWDHLEEIIRRSFVNEQLKRSHYKFLQDLLKIITSYAYDLNIKKMDSYELWKTEENYLKLKGLILRDSIRKMAFKMSTTFIF